MLIINDIAVLARYWLYIKRMNRRITIILTALAVPTAGFAQTEWSMRQCISYAVEHSTEVGRQKIEQRQALTDYRTSLLDFLPSVSAQVGGQYNWGRNIDPETNTYNNVTTFNNNYSLSASLPIFDGGQTWNAFRKARLAKNTSATAVQKARDDKAIDVMQKFIDAAYAIESIKLMRKKLDDSQALQMESQVAEDDYNLLHQQNLARTALLSLKSAMNYPTEDTLSIDCSIAALTPTLPFGLTVSEQAVNSKPGIVMAEADAEKARLDWKIQLPSLYLGGGVSTSYYKNMSSDLAIEPFRSQMRNNLGEYVTLTLSIPIFSPSTWRSVKQAKTSYRLAQLDVIDAKRQLHDDATQAIIDYEGYAKELRQMMKKTAADSLAYRLSYRKYEEGMLSTFDLHESAQTYLESQITLLQMRMLVAIRQKLVNYYINNEPLWTLN